MNKKNIIFGVGAMLLLLASCSGEKTLEGYNFNGEGFLGKLPMAQATKLVTLREIGEELKSDNHPDVNLRELSKMDEDERNKKIQEVRDYLQKQDDKYNHCLDDLRKDLAADTARLVGMKDLLWENKTKCNFKLVKVELGGDAVHNNSQGVTLCFNTTDNVDVLPDGGLHYALLDNKGKFMSGGDLWFKHDVYELGLGYSFMEKGMQSLMQECLNESKFSEMMSALQKSDSIVKILIVDSEQYLDYEPKMTIDGMGPVVFGADMKTLPASYNGLYNKYEDMMAMDCLVYSFEDIYGTSLFTAIGDNEGKIDEIEVESQYYPLKLGDKVLRTCDKLRDVIAKFGKQMTWTYDEESLNAVGAMENGRVTIKLIIDVFTPAGQAKVQKLVKGAKVEIVPADINPSEILNYYQIHSKK